MEKIRLIILIFFIIYILYIASIPYISSSRVIIWALIALQIYTIYYIKKNTSSEEFHFEVSPEREKCLEEQVSLEQPPGVRSKGCCPVTHRGGNLKYVNEWKEKVWARPDMYVDTPQNNVYQTQLPPTGLFEEK